MRRDQSWDDLQATDHRMCSRFGAGAFPCGPAFKVLADPNLYLPRAS